MRPSRKRPIVEVQPSQLAAVQGGTTAAPKPKADEVVYLEYKLKDVYVSGYSS